MNNAEGSGVSNVRTADAATFVAASLLALSILFFSTQQAYALSTTSVSGTITGNTIWSPSGGVYYITADLTIPPASSLTILPGTIVKINYQTSIINHGTLTIGADGARTFVTSIADDTVGGDTNGDGTATEPGIGNWGRIETTSGASTIVVNSTLRYAGWTQPPTADMFLNSGGMLSIRNSTLSDDYLLINSEGGTTTISNSSLSNALYYGVYLGSGSVDARNDWWGDPSGPYATSNPDGTGLSVSDGVLISPWLTQDPDTICTANCESNVLFIPGLESSRLYTSLGGAEQKLWEPGFFSDQGDVKDLYLDGNGNSINPIYTKANGAIDTEGADTPIGITIQSDDVYKTFLQQLAGLKSNSTIADYLVFPYDWRMSPADIVNKGTQYDDGTHYIDQELVTLAASSKTGKVTIVAHSNGGLVAKELMIKLQSEGKSNLVDKILFVDVPQTGTPEAIASMLHGDFQKIPDSGFMASQSNARGLAENMPDGYDLLPSAAYFAKVATPVVDLSNAPVLKSTSGITPNTITTSSNLAKFITGAGGRQKPSYADTETPDVLSSTLLANAATLHSAIDSWQPPAGVQVIQIAGWGIDTPSGITYSEEPFAQCQNGSCTIMPGTRHVVNMTEDGDKTVVIPSQVATTTWPTYYINLHDYNDVFHTRFNHADITEIPTFQALLSSLLATTSPGILPSYVTKTEPIASSTDKELRLRVLSPVSLDAYDSLGNHTGMAPNPNPQSDDLYVEEQIPGSYYQQYGEGQYIGLPADGNYRVILHGEDTGTFTFQVTPVSGGVAGAPVTFADVPVTASSTAAINITGLAPASTTLALDENGDGIVDMTIASSSQTTDPLAYAKIVQSSIALMDIGAPVQKQLQAKFTNMIYLLTKVDQWDADDDDARDTAKADKVSVRVIRKLGKIETYIDNEIGKPVSKRDKDERITSAQAAAITDMIEELKVLVNAKQP